MKWRLLLLFMRVIGRLSKGIRLGLHFGFNSWQYVEHIYENSPQGTTSVGVLIDRRFLSHPLSQAIRSRRQQVVEQLMQATSHYDRPVVYDLAAGVGSYLFLLPFNRATIIAADYDPEAIKRGQELSRMRNRPDIKFVLSNAFILEDFPVAQADVLVCAGFFDTLSDYVIKAVLENGSAITKPGGRWVFSVQENHYYEKEVSADLSKPAKSKLRTATGTVMLRSAAELADWAAAFGWKLEAVQRNQFFAIGTLVRTSIK